MRYVKNQQKNLILLLYIIFFTAIFILQQSEIKAKEYILQDSSKQMKMSNMGQKSMNGVKSQMQMMNNHMMSIKMTGDPDYDFAQMMLAHHKGAVNMSKDEVSKGKDNSIKSIAQKAIDDKNKEITQLQNFVNNNKPSKSGIENKNMTGSSPKKTMAMDMRDMNKKMQSVEMKGDQDKDYTAMMIMHDQQAIQMAQNYLNKGTDENMKKLAKQIIDEDTKQINKLRSWQSDHQ